MIDNRVDFADKFNRLVGTKMGKPLVPGARITGNPDTMRKASALRPTKKVGGAAKKRTSSAGSLTDVEQFYRENAGEVKEDRPWWQDVMKSVIGAKDTTSSMIIKPLDLLNRPLATVSNAMQEAVDATAEGEPIWSLGDDVFRGAYSGVTGQDKDNTGDLLQSVKNLRDTPDTGWGNRLTRKLISDSGFGTVADASTAAEDVLGDNNFLTRNLDRAAGGAFDMALDPLSHVGGKIVTQVVKGTSGATGRDAVKEVAERAALKADEVAKASGGNLDLPTQLRSAPVDASGRSIDDLLASANPIDQKMGADLAARRTQSLAREQTDARLINDYETGKLTDENFVRNYAGQGTLTSKNLTRKISSAYKGKATYKEVADEIVKFRKAEIKTATRSVNEIIPELIAKRLDDLVHEVQTGPQAGKIAGGAQRDLTNTIAQDIASTAREGVRSELNTAVEVFKAGLGNSKAAVSVSRLKHMRENVPYFKEWHDKYQSVLGTLSVSNPQRVATQQAIRHADDAVRNLIAKEGDQIFAAVKGNITDSLIKVPTLRVFGQDVASFPKLAAKGAKASRYAKSYKGVDALTRAFNYSSGFPGHSTLIAQKAKALGVSRYENFRQETIKVARTTNKKERIMLQEMLQNGQAPSDPRLLAAYNYLRRSYDEMFNEEIAAGVRKIKSSDNIQDYAYTYIKPGRSTVDVEQLIKQKKIHVKSAKDLKGYTAADLKAKGLRVEEDAFKNLLMRKVKSQRNLTKAYFRRDLITHYSIRDSLTANEALARNLVKIDLDSENYALQAMKQTLGKGEHLYYDKEIHKIWQTYLGGANLKMNQEARELVRQLDYVTRKFKTLNTVYFPGFHVRNMIGDMFFGLMDGVKTSRYAEVIKSYYGGPTATLRVGNRRRNMEELKTLYYTNLGSGAFFNADLGSTIGTKSRTPAQFVRKVSEDREDFGRFVHFYHALDEETKSFLRKGYPADKAEQLALETASFRVNKYKFDYDALTDIEKKYVRRGIPFYTFFRKAAVTLAESLMLNPRYMGAINRMQSSLEDGWEDTILPDWMREIGYMRVPGTDYGVSDVILPTGIMRELGSNPIARLNPVAQTLIETNTGIDSFSGAPIQGDNAWERLPTVLTNKWRGFNTFYNPTGKQALLGNTEKTSTEKVFNFLGIPLRRVDAVETEQALQEMKYNLGKTIEGLNKQFEDKGYKFYVSNRKDGISIRVSRLDSEEVIYEARTLTQAKEFLESL